MAETITAHFSDDEYRKLKELAGKQAAAREEELARLPGDWQESARATAAYLGQDNLTAEEEIEREISRLIYRTARDELGL